MSEAFIEFTWPGTLERPPFTERIPIVDELPDAPTVGQLVVLAPGRAVAGGRLYVCRGSLGWEPA